MRFFVKRDTSDAHARFEIADEKGEPVYRAVSRRSKRSASGESLRIQKDGESLVKIRELALTVFKAFSVSTPEESLRLLITENGSSFSVRFHGISWHIRGDILSGSYDIMDADGTVICAVSKSFSKGYTALEVFCPTRALFCIAAVLCVEMMGTVAAPALAAN